jgi:hypothetical protein
MVAADLTTAQEVVFRRGLLRIAAPLSGGHMGPPLQEGQLGAPLHDGHDWADAPRWPHGTVPTRRPRRTNMRQDMSDFSVRSDSVDVEQITRQTSDDCQPACQR